MSYEVSIVADSIGPNKARITTFQLKYPRMIHAELMTHRMFSRNASSTRAIPTAKMIEWIEEDPAMPVYWGKNQKGMQAGEELDKDDISMANAIWLDTRDVAVLQAKKLMKLGVHKQIASRILEPWAHINVIVTATSYDNFFALRCHKAAMPEIQHLAVKMARAYRDSEPTYVPSGHWHLPFVSPEELDTLADFREEACEDDEPEAVQRLFEEENRCLKLSVARCARVSYLTFDGKDPDPYQDVKLHDTLQGNGHWSPFEHQARATGYHTGYSGNLFNWIQYRQMLRTNVHKSFDFAALDQFEEVPA